ncbi:MAG TPA: hypothetical protein VE913_22085 [Longimicrobium sp.]|nr:hypothetical protein [Longimicrobium sp.]
MHPDPSPHGTQALVLRMIRASLVASVLVFLAVTSQLRHPESEGTLSVGYAATGAGFLSLAAIALVRARSRVAATRADRATLCIVGWAIGEGVALFGAVSYFLGNEPVWSAAGMVAFAVALVALPIPEDAG